MTPLEQRLQVALARLVGETMSGGVVEPTGRDLRRNAAVAEAEDLLAELNTSPDLYARLMPSTPPIREVG